MTYITRWIAKVGTLGMSGTQVDAHIKKLKQLLTEGDKPFIDGSCERLVVIAIPENNDFKLYTVDPLYIEGSEESGG